MPATESAENYIKVQPESGYLYERIRQSTVYLIVGGQQMESPPEKVVSPLPALDAIYGVAIPIYDIQESVVANEQIFVDKFNYISET